MKKVLFITALVLTSLVFIAYKPVYKVLTKDSIVFKTGDIIYQSNDYGQSKAVKLATHSKYSHVGLVLVKDGVVSVLEAVQPVQIIPIEDWIARGKDKNYCLQRLKTEVDLNIHAAALDSISEQMVGKNYDLLFEWSDERLYCSELVWKVYKEVFEVQLSELKQLKDFDLTHPYTQKIMTQRYGANYPLEQKVVAPQDLYESELLKIIVE